MNISEERLEQVFKERDARWIAELEQSRSLAKSLEGQLRSANDQVEALDVELERVKRQNASMASCLSHIKQLALECREDPKIILSAVGLSACGGLDPDAGRDHIAKESVRPVIPDVVSELADRWKSTKAWHEMAEDHSAWCGEIHVDVRDCKECFDAISHARQLGLLEDTK